MVYVVNNSPLCVERADRIAMASGWVERVDRLGIISKFVSRSSFDLNDRRHACVYVCSRVCVFTCSLCHPRTNSIPSINVALQAAMTTFRTPWRSKISCRLPGAVALTVGSVPRRHVPRLRHLYCLFIFNNQ